MPRTARALPAATALLVLFTVVGGRSGAAERAVLRFAADGVETNLTKAELRARCDLRVVQVEDPYYGEKRRYRACPMARIFELGLGVGPDALAHRELLLVALDGYTRTASGSLFTEGAAFLAFEDADRAEAGESEFEPIDRKQADPAPFYLVWSGPGRADVHRYPWPYQLAAIEVTSYESQFPHTLPAGTEKDSPAWRGFERFRAECSHCHAINGEGGTVGPDLNVPRSIVEYRPVGQIKAYIRNPESFRYTTMPAHQHLSDEELEELVAYFRHMSHHKYDPGGR